MKCGRGDASVLLAGPKTGRPSLEDLKKRLYQLDHIGAGLAEQAWLYQAARLKPLLRDDEARKLLDQRDIELLQGELADVQVDPSLALLPSWLRRFLEQYWQEVVIRYRVDLRNLSAWGHDFVVAYETKSGLVTITETTLGPWASGYVMLAPCWDMQSVAISVWNPDDNTELVRTPTWTVAEIATLTGRQCSFIFEFEASYE